VFPCKHTNTSIFLKVEDWLNKLPSWAAQRLRENRQFFQQLKKRPPKKLDQQVLRIHHEVFKRIDCLNCAQCCTTTGPLYTDKDIVRIAKHLRLTPQKFIATYLRVDEDGDQVLQQLPCPFLGGDNKCSIYEVRPKACAEYPHTDRPKIYQIAEITLKNTAICPAAFEVVEQMKKEIK
jgi:Fe-S-cluster containining protein